MNIEDKGGSEGLLDARVRTESRNEEETRVEVKYFRIPWRTKERNEGIKERRGRIVGWFRKRKK